MRESTAKVDTRTLELIRIRNPRSPLTMLMRTLSLVGEHAMVWVGLGGLLGLIDGRRRGAWVVAGLVGPASILLNFCLKQMFRRQRPVRESDRGQERGRISYSFPSAHATSSFAAATVASRVDNRARTPALTMACAISYSRVHLGRHYPSDVVAGGILGAVSGRMAWRWLSTPTWGIGR